MNIFLNVRPNVSTHNGKFKVKKMKLKKNPWSSLKMNSQKLKYTMKSSKNKIDNN
jgi:hypothetical protein